MPYLDGLPPATEINATDILPVDQGSTGIAGTGTTKQATVQQLFNALVNGTVLLTDLPTSSAGLPPGAVYLNGQFLCVVP